MDGEDRQQQGQQQQRLMCPRCESMDTKFCYFNNCKISQPRYFCKTCRRYWTYGGTLRNIPVRARLNKGRRYRAPSSSTSSGGGGEILRAVISSPPPPPLAIGSGAGGVNNLHLSGGGFRLPTQNLIPPQHNPPQLSFTRGNYMSLLRGYNNSLNPFIANRVCQGQGQSHPVGQLYQLPNHVQACFSAHPILPATSLWTPPVISTTHAPSATTTSYTHVAANADIFWDNSGSTISGTSNSSFTDMSGHLPGFGPFA